MRAALGSLVLVLLAPATVPAQRPAAPTEVGAPSDIQARIEIQRSSYAVGDTACIRVALVNVSDRRVGITASTGASDNGHWLDMPRGLKNVLLNGRWRGVTHGLCPSCFDSAVEAYQTRP